jgi:hypothetical protein
MWEFKYPFSFFSMSWPIASTPNLEDQVIFDQGFLPLALDRSVSDYLAAVLVLVRPGYSISPEPAISGELFPIHHTGRRPMEKGLF